MGGLTETEDMVDPDAGVDDWELQAARREIKPAKAIPTAQRRARLDEFMSEPWKTFDGRNETIFRGLVSNCRPDFFAFAFHSGLRMARTPELSLQFLL